MVDDQDGAPSLNGRHRLMPEPVAPPAAPPEAPPSPPQIDPLAPPQYVPVNPENDPDHLLKQMVSRRRKPPVESPAGLVPPASTVEAPAPTPKPPEAGFNDAIAGVLRFKPAPKKKAEPKVEEPPAEPTAPPAAPAAPAEPPKTIVTKKKAVAPVAPDITQITTAATTAAVRAIRGEPKAEAPALKPEEALKSEDRHDYEVAKALAESNPKYKDAPKVVLDHVKKSEAYAARWEADNKGKAFDPNDDEHNEFFDSLEKPWSDHEFRTAEIEMAAERVAAKNNRHADTKIKALEQDNARLELTPIIERTFLSAVGAMAKELQVEDKLSATAFDKFREDDPITGDAMVMALRPVQAIIEAIVQLDDPKGRFHLDENNPAHQAWMQLLDDKQAQYAGVESEDGKMFATRMDYSRMSPAQRAKHWYLTADHLVTEVVQDAVAAAAERVKTEKEKYKKIALSLGYSPAATGAVAAAKAAATNGATNTEHGTAPSGVVKPASPSVGSGAKIDAKGEANKTGRAATLAAMGDILFRPGNPVS